MEKPIGKRELGRPRTDGVDEIHPIYHTHKWKALVSAVMNCWVFICDIQIKRGIGEGNHNYILQ